MCLDPRVGGPSTRGRGAEGAGGAGDQAQARAGDHEAVANTKQRGVCVRIGQMIKVNSNELCV